MDEQIMTDAEKKLGDLIAKIDPSLNFIDNFDSFLNFGLSLFIANQSEEMQKTFIENVQNPYYQSRCRHEDSFA